MDRVPVFCGPVFWGRPCGQPTAVGQEPALPGPNRGQQGLAADAGIGVAESHVQRHGLNLWRAFGRRRHDVLQPRLEAALAGFDFVAVAEENRGNDLAVDLGAVGAALITDLETALRLRMAKCRPDICSSRGKA